MNKYCDKKMTHTVSSIVGTSHQLEVRCGWYKGETKYQCNQCKNEQPNELEPVLD